ncbi:MAG TPA: hypothetical protein VK483_04325 [Chitinophagaceae bacterium]|nr:hypothetical protein [Chitinophagaceae bacterium]
MAGLQGEYKSSLSLTYLKWMEKFEIEQKDFESALFYLLIRMAARQRATEQFIIDHLSNITPNTRDELRKLFDETTAFHRQKVYEELFQNFASLKDLFGKETDGKD